jgi:hypothetical protein
VYWVVWGMLVARYVNAAGRPCITSEAILKHFVVTPPREAANYNEPKSAIEV